MLRRRSLAPLAFLLPALAVYALFVLFPIAQAAWYSLWEWRYVATERHFVGLGNYVFLLHDPVFWLALRNNVLLVALSLLIQLPIALGLAVLLSYVKRGRGLLRTVYFAPMVLPTVAVGLIWMFLYEPDRGLVARFLSLFVENARCGWLGDTGAALLAVTAAICWRFIGFHMVLFIAGVESISEELYEAGRMDGASEWQLLRHVTLPALWPVIQISAVLSMVGSLKYFDLIYIMTKGGPPEHATELMTTYMYKVGINEYTGGYGSALAVAGFLVSGIIVACVMALRARRAAGEATP